MEHSEDRRRTRKAAGKAVRKRLPLDGHAQLPSVAERPDPVTLLEEQAVDRVAQLLPIRYGRMLASPFSFYRGAARIMTSDLAAVPRTTLMAQLCGDAHASNFGMFASAERRLVFDLNDFDETLPGPFEWDVKRLAASLELAARDIGMSAAKRRSLVVGAVEHYRTTMRSFAQQGTLKVWYAGIDVDELVASQQVFTKKRQQRVVDEQVRKARSRDGRQALRKLTEWRDGRLRIVHDPPLVQTIENLAQVKDPDAVVAQVDDALREYRRTLPPDRRGVLAEFRVIDIAHKVVGVGSVGSRAWIVLMQGPSPDDTLLLQLKQATTSVLEFALRPSPTEQHGQRVVLGQRLMQAAGDPFLGWRRMPAFVEGTGSIDYYVRQLRDWKGSVPLDQLRPPGLTTYGQLCAWTLARAHARTGDRFAIAGYLGTGSAFEQAVGEFASGYADLNDRDYQALSTAEAEGRVPTTRGV